MNLDFSTACNPFLLRSEVFFFARLPLFLPLRLFVADGRVITTVCSPYRRKHVIASQLPFSLPFLQFPLLFSLSAPVNRPPCRSFLFASTFHVLTRSPEVGQVRFGTGTGVGSGPPPPPPPRVSLPLPGAVPSLSFFSSHLFFPFFPPFPGFVRFSAPPARCFPL